MTNNRSKGPHLRKFNTLLGEKKSRGRISASFITLKKKQLTCSFDADNLCAIDVQENFETISFSIQAGEDLLQQAIIEADLTLEPPRAQPEEILFEEDEDVGVRKASQLRSK